MTAATDPRSAETTLRTVELVKNKLGVKTMLGVSNISFGLPERENVNSAFLTLAMSAGLDYAIMNPNSEVMSGIVRGYRMLKGIYTGSFTEPAKVSKNKTEHITLSEAICGGLKREAARIAAVMIKTSGSGFRPLDIIDGHVVPALDKVGADYETKKLYLPQLIAAAEAAGACFEIVKAAMPPAADGAAVSGGIILAAVRGDIHDIGKNIVKVLLESYGFPVIDLGKNVPPKTVLDTAAERGVRLVGLSALMTTTLPAMEETVTLLKKNLPQVKIMVGGAVLTREYAKKIGADFYCKDARAATEVAKNILTL